MNNDYDIAVKNADGVTIYYNYINEGKELEIVYIGVFRDSVVIPEEVSYMTRTRKVTGIGERAFEDCIGLTSITIPNSMSSIGENAFRGCFDLTTVYLSSLESWCKTVFSDEFSNPFMYARHLVLNGVEIRDLVIPNSVKRIGNYAFYNCKTLISVTIGEGVTKIGDCAFADCDGLISVKIPESVKSIGEGAFNGCRGLTSITLENGVSIIEDSTFYDCWRMTSVTIPNSVKSIGNHAFSGCFGLTSITIPGSVKSIGNYAFYKCSGLTSVTIVNGVTNIGTGAFLDCLRLISVTIPNSVTSIGWGAFNCQRLLEVISKIENPFIIDPATFSDNTLYNATLHVPTGIIDKYKVMEGWKKFVFMKEG